MNVKKRISISLFEFLWYVIWSGVGIGLTVYDTMDYIRVGRPIDRCLHQKQTACPVDGQVLYITYGPGDDYGISKKEIG